jgi:hypothetical protein
MTTKGREKQQREQQQQRQQRRQQPQQQEPQQERILYILISAMKFLDKFAAKILGKNSYK